VRPLTAALVVQAAAVAATALSLSLNPDALAAAMVSPGPPSALRKLTPLLSIAGPRVADALGAAAAAADVVAAFSECVSVLIVAAAFEAGWATRGGGRGVGAAPAAGHGW
jgi:hypothetical protein